MENSPKSAKKQGGYLGHDHAKHNYILGFFSGISFITLSSLVILGIVVNTHSMRQATIDSIPEDVVFDAENTEEAAPYEEVDTIDPDSLRYVKGEGKITFIEYSDLECPFCKTFHPVVNELARDYSGKIAFTFKHFPLNIHPKAKREAVAAECAGTQNAFFQYVDRIFEVTDSNNSLPDDTLFEVAEELNLDMDTFRTCVENEETLDAVAADALEAQGTGGTGTPHSILIDEDGNVLTTFKGALKKEQLSAAFDQYLGE